MTSGRTDSYIVIESIDPSYRIKLEDIRKLYNVEEINDIVIDAHIDLMN
jgi:hypothetical protein